MKWETKLIDKKDSFKPFSLTLTFDTKEEYIHFHNNIMGQLKPEIKNDPMYGAIYSMGEGKNAPEKGEI